MFYLYLFALLQIHYNMHALTFFNLCVQSTFFRILSIVLVSLTKKRVKAQVRLIHIKGAKPTLAPLF